MVPCIIWIIFIAVAKPLHANDLDRLREALQEVLTSPKAGRQNVRFKSHGPSKNRLDSTNVQRLFLISQHNNLKIPYFIAKPVKEQQRTDRKEDSKSRMFIFNDVKCKPGARCGYNHDYDIAIPRNLDTKVNFIGNLQTNLDDNKYKNRVVQFLDDIENYLIHENNGVQDKDFKLPCGANRCDTIKGNYVAENDHRNINYMVEFWNDLLKRSQKSAQNKKEFMKKYDDDVMAYAYGTYKRCCRNCHRPVSRTKYQDPSSEEDSREQCGKCSNCKTEKNKKNRRNYAKAGYLQDIDDALRCCEKCKENFLNLNDINREHSSFGEPKS